MSKNDMSPCERCEDKGLHGIMGLCPRCGKVAGSPPYATEQLMTKKGEQPQGEPVGTLLIDEYFDNREVGEVDVQLDAKVCEQLAEKFPGQSLPLYAHADPGEVEKANKLAEAAADQVVKLLAQLRDANDKLADRDALLRELADAPPAAMEFRLQQKVKAALSASAEPSAPVTHPINMKTMMQAYEQVDHKALLHGTSNWCSVMATALRGVLNVEPSAPLCMPAHPCVFPDSCGHCSKETSAPVEIDERAEFEAHIEETESQWDLMLVRVDAEHKIHGHPRDIGEYAVPETHAAWMTWQARAALARKP